MPKHKPARKSPSLDMTAMCDVAFLLLTFFMLTAKMKPQEAVVVDTPSSISETLLPDANTLMITVAKDGKVYLDMAGSHTRKLIAERVNSHYKLGMTEEDILKFANAGGFGVPVKDLRGYLRTSPAERTKLTVPGIPCDTTLETNELGPWVKFARRAQFDLKQEGKVKDEYVIIVKGDKDTPYPAVQKVINTLTDNAVHKFNLITSLESDPSKLAAAGKKTE